MQELFLGILTSINFLLRARSWEFEPNEVDTGTGPLGCPLRDRYPRTRLRH